MTGAFLCACTKLVCKGICKEKNLFRKRKTLDKCPAAYTKMEERKRGVR